MLKLLQFRYLLTTVLVWRIGLYVIAAVSPFLLDFHSTFVNAELLNSLLLPKWLVAFANFDGVHFLTLVSRGYRAVGFIQAFFPGLPLLLQPVWQMTHSLAAVVVFGQLLSLTSLLVALYLYTFIAARYAKFIPSTYGWLLIVILLFPTSFYFSAVYTESLFLALALGAFVAASRERWWLAGLLAAIASGTRVVGILLVPALIIELGLQTGLWQKQVVFSRHRLAAWLKKHKGSLAKISLGSLGLVLYSIYLWYYFADPLYYFHVQSEFGGGRQETIVLFPQVVWRYLKILATVPLDLRYLIYVEEFLAGVGGLIILLIGYKKIRPSLWFFSLAALLLPTVTGTFSSMARYIIVVPAVFLILNLMLSSYPRLRIAWLVLSTLLLVFNTVLFIQGYWVA